jgi:hypothetical protein
MTTFASLVQEIETKYELLEHNLGLGWRFLYTPERTFSPDTQIALLPINPGGRKPKPPMPSVESGNAYRVERWENGRHNTLQEQIMLLYRELAGRLGNACWTQLMDDSLAANFCPFRSPGWPPPVGRGEWIKFSSSLWRKVLSVASPSVIICLGEAPRTYIPKTLAQLGASLAEEPSTEPVHWAANTYSVADYHWQGRTTRVVGVPHLGRRCAIFGRDESRSATDAIVRAIAESTGLG